MAAYKPHSSRYRWIADRTDSTTHQPYSRPIENRQARYRHNHTRLSVSRPPSRYTWFASENTTKQPDTMDHRQPIYRYNHNHLAVSRPIGQQNNVTQELKKKKVLIAGSSYVRRLKEFAIEKEAVNLNVKKCNIHWHGVGGNTIDKFREYDMSVVKNLSPDIVFLQIGSNDLCHKTRGEPELVFTKLEAAIKDLQDIGVSHVVVGQIFYRKKADIGVQVFNARVTDFNALCDKELHSQPGGKFWKHDGMTAPEKKHLF